MAETREVYRKATPDELKAVRTYLVLYAATCSNRDVALACCVLCEMLAQWAEADKAEGVSQ